MMTPTDAQWTSLHLAGLTYGDTFIWQGSTKATYTFKRVEVRIVRTVGSSYELRATEDDRFIERATSLKSAKWWIGEKPAQATDKVDTVEKFDDWFTQAFGI